MKRRVAVSGAAEHPDPDEKRVELLNEAAGVFFRVVQDTLWAVTLIDLCRLTDPAGTGKRSRLTLMRLPSLIADQRLSRRVNKLTHNARAKTRFARDWRNRYLAHADLAHALDPHSHRLAKANRGKVRLAFQSIAATLNAVQSHYCGSETHYEPIGGDSQDATALIDVLREGLAAGTARRKRLCSGTFTTEDLQPPCSV